MDGLCENNVLSTVFFVLCETNVLHRIVFGLINVLSKVVGLIAQLMLCVGVALYVMNELRGIKFFVIIFRMKFIVEGSNIAGISVFWGLFTITLTGCDNNATAYEMVVLSMFWGLFSISAPIYPPTKERADAFAKYSKNNYMLKFTVNKQEIIKTSKDASDD